jgi:hypothetical protein
MNRKRREANVRRAMAAGRSRRPRPLEHVGPDLREEQEVHSDSMAILPELTDRDEGRATALRGT